MIYSHIEILKEIVLEMKSAITSGRQEISEDEYLLWVSFLKQVRPENDQSKGKIENVADEETKTFSDLREIMMLAEAAGYPTWHIQPKFSEELIAEYLDGELKNICVKKNGQMEKLNENDRWNIPEHVIDFTGKLFGTWCEKEDKLQFVTYDTDQNMDFLDRMKWLESTGMNIAEYVLFPTDKIPTTPMSKLAALFQNYISKVREQGLKVDGVVIISNTPIIDGGKRLVSNRIVLLLV
jgi:hypothetical protein